MIYALYLAFFRKKREDDLNHQVSLYCRCEFHQHGNYVYVFFKGPNEWNEGIIPYTFDHHILNSNCWKCRLKAQGLVYVHLTSIRLEQFLSQLVVLSFVLCEYPCKALNLLFRARTHHNLHVTHFFV